MGSSETPLKLPITDFSKQALTLGSKEWETVRTQVHNALEEYGCFEALFYKVPQHFRKSIFQSMEELFNLTLQTKMQNVSKKTLPWLCWPPHGGTIYESMGVDVVNVYEQVQSLINTLWPQGNPSFWYSTGLFSVPKEGYIIKAPDEVVDEEHPLIMLNFLTSVIQMLARELPLL
ncbi:unnamed protein product [Prunus armeniaca]|uniref:Non-haem dioxygenase N-terminal domain-containing protein n=1 Tax=Prunus armeniaca TaxID=36596 RepID=A0A6J5U9V4_PRUAR|nr:unnamed protein product [Prunus armeniaca]